MKVKVTDLNTQRWFILTEESFEGPRKGYSLMDKSMYWQLVNSSDKCVSCGKTVYEKVLE